MADAATIHRQMFEAIQDRDWGRLESFFHADYVYRGEDGIEHKGFEAALEVAQTYTTAFPDLRMEVTGQLSSGDTSVLEIVGRGTHQGELQGIAPTGRTCEVVLCNVIELRDGKVINERDYFDNLSLLRQLGVMDE